MPKHKRLEPSITARRLSELEADSGVTQRETANAIGMYEQTYSNKKNGLRPFTKKDLIALADHFHVSVDYLLGRDPQPNHPTTMTTGGSAA